MKQQLVTMTTHVDHDAGMVVYAVWTGDPLAGDFGNQKEVWRREVPFGLTERFLPGGAAFREAAAEQEQIAEGLARGDA